MNGRQTAAEIQGLHARYGRVEAVAGIDLTIEQGSLVALLGPNGAGKSTTINCLIGLKHIDEVACSLPERPRNRLSGGGR